MTDSNIHDLHVTHIHDASISSASPHRIVTLLMLSALKQTIIFCAFANPRTCCDRPNISMVSATLLPGYPHLASYLHTP
jgi:hypothetical protein